jgi:hypothetical protein
VEYIKKHEPKNKMTNTNSKKMNQHSLDRYGCYSLCYQNRNGEICFKNNLTNEQFIMDPRDIALTEELITEFDATQAFYIGILAGLKINNFASQSEASKNKRPDLYIIK